MNQSGLVWLAQYSRSFSSVTQGIEEMRAAERRLSLFSRRATYSWLGVFHSRTTTTTTSKVALSGFIMDSRYSWLQQFRLLSRKVFLKLLHWFQRSSFSSWYFGFLLALWQTFLARRQDEPDLLVPPVVCSPTLVQTLARHYRVTCINWTRIQLTYLCHCWSLRILKFLLS